MIILFVMKRESWQEIIGKVRNKWHSWDLGARQLMLLKNVSKGSVSWSFLYLLLIDDTWIRTSYSEVIGKEVDRYSRGRSLQSGLGFFSLPTSKQVRVPFTNFQVGFSALICLLRFYSCRQTLWVCMPSLTQSLQTMFLKTIVFMAPTTMVIG